AFPTSTPSRATTATPAPCASSAGRTSISARSSPRRNWRNMDFRLQPEHVALRKLIREFAMEELRPRAKEVDRTGQVAPEVMRMMADIGLFGVPFPQEYGGMGAGEVGYVILMEE